MNEATKPEDDLLALWMAQIRADADRKRASVRRPCTDGAGPRIPPFNWPQLNIALTQVASHALVGTELPPIRRFRGPLRYLALFVGKVVLYLSKSLTARQREFNLSLLQTVREIGVGVRNLELRVDRQAERLKQLETVLRQAPPVESRRAS